MAEFESIPWSPLHPFDRDSILAHAPRMSGLYKLVDRDGRTAYLGISQTSSVDQHFGGRQVQRKGSSSIQRRLLDHWDAKGGGNKYIAKLRVRAEATGGDLGFSFAYYVCDAASARALEAVRTTTGKPILNTRSEWSGLWEEFEDEDGTLWRVKHVSAHFH